VARRRKGWPGGEQGGQEGKAPFPILPNHCPTTTQPPPTARCGDAGVALAGLALECLARPERASAEAALDYFSMVNTVGWLVIRLGRLGGESSEPVGLAVRVGLAWGWPMAVRVGLASVLNQSAGLRSLPCGGPLYLLFLFYLSLLICHPCFNPLSHFLNHLESFPILTNAQVPTSERHPQLCGPLFASALPHLVRHACHPEGFTTWDEAEGDEDEEAFHRCEPFHTKCCVL
jgi:hypothetical protein